MSPSRVEKESSISVQPITHPADKLCKMGAVVTGVDLNSLSDEDLQVLKEATYKYKVIIIKAQHDLEPINQWNLVTRLDPTAPQIYGHGSMEQFKKTGGMLSQYNVSCIPSAPTVRLIGKGYQGPDNYGVKDFHAVGPSNDFHAYPPTEEAFEAGNTQFQRWHMDAPLYERDPPHFTTLRAIKLPVGPDLTVNWDDGSGLSMKAKPGQTAFYSDTQLYEMLNEEEKMLADNSWVEYAPHPYKWVENCKGNTNGLGILTQCKEHTLEELPEYDEALVKTYPFVWKTPLGEKSLQVHGLGVRKLFLKRSPSSEVEVIEDLVKIREVLSNLQYRILRPEYIFLPPVEEGDVQMWDNWAVFHSAIDYPLKYGIRSEY
ncbi:MAG: hypothetical protein M1818_003647 [Claussenomyces sp. TS43310]|nr:MAG: hypothetical protein M1818_003647 [Claussenomyces sp. TS43310]